MCCFLEDLRGIDQTNRRLRMFGFGLFAAIYFLSFLQRVAVSVVADDLTMELGLDSVALGFMSSGFFIAYALVQPALGLLCDKAGPARMRVGAPALAAAGAFLHRRLSQIIEAAPPGALDPAAVGDVFLQLFSFRARSLKTQHRLDGWEGGRSLESHFDHAVMHWNAGAGIDDAAVGTGQDQFHVLSADHAIVELVCERAVV